ncbi:MAG: alpha/beta fold hydrolase [Alphaproteobacteria bacterium]|nr:alpha/beta fold hydrolase [Alphaproteobacteria bacterium]MBV9863150.1 alpha/beta fold hydrolase [Alphaproteobacteria bacterium]
MTAGFSEDFVEADGFRIRYLAGGDGPPLVHLHGAGGLRLNPAHDLIARQFRVVAFEMPGFGNSAENQRTRDLPDLAATMARAIDRLGLEAFSLMGTSFGARVALWLALQQPERVSALVLDAPAAIRPQGAVPPSGSPEEMARRLYAHPERQPALPRPDPGVEAKTRALVARLRGPDRDPDLERQLPGLTAPVLVLFGTLDAVIPPEMGRHYKELLPNAHLVFIYDAGHAIGSDRPEAFAEVVTDFLERGEAFIISRGETVIYP